MAALATTAKAAAQQREDSPEGPRQAPLVQRLAPVEPVVLSWDGLNLDVDAVKVPAKGLCGRPVMEKKRILHDAAGVICPGDLVAVMGSSGAGKTTLLNVISGRNKKASGQVLVNNRPRGSNFTALSAFVQQESMFIGTLRVREHLRFSSILRMDQSCSTKDINEHVDRLIEALHLEKCENGLIGSLAAGHGRGISGGERKRLSFASEVITNPSIFFADEPTSGLDSNMAAGVVHTMSELAQAGRAVVATIHQPSTEVYNMFNMLLLVADGGRTVYFGPPEAAIGYFATLGRDYVCPEHYNPAEFWIKVLADAVTKEGEVDRLVAAWQASDIRACMMRRRENPSAFAGLPGCEGRNLAAPRPGDPTAPAAAAIAATVAPAGGHLHATGGKVALQSDNPSAVSAVRRFRASWCREFGVLLQRSWKATSRDPILTYARLAQAIILSVICGLVYWQIDPGAQQSVQDKPGATFFLVINNGMAGLIGVLQTFPLERPIFQREHEAGTYRVSTYYLSRSVVDVGFQIIFPVLFCAIAYWMINLEPTFWRFAAFTGIVTLVANAAISLGYCISTAVPSVQVALGVGPVVLLPFVLTGGFFANADTIPGVLRWLQTLSFFNYGFSAGMTVLWAGVEMDSCAPDDGELCFQTGDQVLKFFSVDKDNLFRDVMALTIMVVGFRLLSYVFLLLRARQSSE